MGKLRAFGTRTVVKAFSRLINGRQADDYASVPHLQDHRVGPESEVEEYCSHSVMKSLVSFRWESGLDFRLLCAMHPLLSELMEYDVPRDKSRILDYGCRRGDDVYRLLVKNRARRVTAVDVSPTAINCARARISLYREARSRVDFHLMSDQQADLPFEANSFDHINCMGALMESKCPDRILNEFYRLLKPGGDALVMVTVRPSIFFNLYIPYYWLRKRARWPGYITEEACRRGMAGEACTTLRCYRIPEFSSLAESAGFSVEYKGGYFDQNELWLVRKHLSQAIHDETLPPEHRQVLASLTMDKNDYPLINSKFAGASGVFKLSKI